MATTFSKQTRDTAGQLHTLSLDNAPKVQLDGSDVTFGTQPTATNQVALTYGGLTFTIPAADLGHVGFAGTPLISPGAGAVVQSALGRLAAVAINAGASQATVFGVNGL